MNPDTHIKQDWYIVFTRSKLDHWIFKFLNPEFQHCYMVKEDEGLWVIVDSKHSHTDVRTEIIEEYPHIRLLCPNAVILPVRIKVESRTAKWHFGLNTCVDVCKGVMGINNWKITTPYQLYRWIHE